MKIYDCFTFFNELDLLEIRLNELYNYVDYFVLVEAKITHSGNPKPLYFEENKKRFKKWEDKIIHIVVDLPKFSFIDKLLMMLEKTKYYKIPRMITSNLGFGMWRLERIQRAFIRKGLVNAEKDDIIMVSDIDEIPRSEKISEMVNLINNYNIIGFSQKMYYFFLNGESSQKWIGTYACKFKVLKKDLKNNPQFLRIPNVNEKILRKFGIVKRDIKIILDAGWHFSYLGGIEKIKEKLNSFAHSEIEAINDKEFNRRLKEGEFIHKENMRKINYIKINKTFPKTIYKNIPKYKRMGFIR